MAIKSWRVSLYKVVRTKDGHTARIYRKRNAWLAFWHSFHVEVLSNRIHSGNKRDIIYAWSAGANPDNAVAQAKAWEATQIFDRNPYLLKAAENYVNNP